MFLRNPRSPRPEHHRTWGLLVLILSGCAVGFASPTRSNAEQISGRALESDGVTPIPGAIVSVQATGIRTTADANGDYTLDGAQPVSLVVVAAAKGYFSASVNVTPPATGVEILLAAVPQDDNPSYAFVAPTTCSICHPNQYNEWLNTPMANAGSNTWVHDIYDGSGTPGGMGGFVYTENSVFANENPNSECAACHQPEVWIDTPFTAMLGPGDVGYPSAGVNHGISCDVCHKVADVDVSKINFPGIFPGAVTFTRPFGPQVEYGVLGDVDFQAPSLMRASYQPQLVAEVCGTCHQDKNDPLLDHSYTGVTSEPTYVEWVNTPYGDLQSPMYTTCVDCHMPPSGDNDICDFLNPPLLRDPNTIRSHTIEGTTALYLENSVDMSMQTQLNGNVLTVDVSILNSGVGHHVPTGVTVRNMILLVEAWRDGDDPLLDPLTHTGAQTIYYLGGVGDPAQGYYAGLPGKFYAKVNEDAQGNGPTFFTDAAAINFDNRIPALANDDTSYTFVAPPGDGTLHVRARLIYRRAFRFLVDAKQWTQDGRGNPLEDIAAPHYGHLMEIAQTDVPFSIPCPPIGDGDTNGDGNVNGLDIGLFLDVLFNSPTGPVGPEFCASDLDGNAVVEPADAGLLVSALLAL